MSRQARRIRQSGWILLTTGGGAWAIYQVLHAHDPTAAAAIWGYLITVAGLVFAMATWLVDRASGSRDDLPSPSQLRRTAGRLAEDVYSQWIKECTKRNLLEPAPIRIRWQAPSERVVGPLEAALSSSRFAPLPGLRATARGDLHAGEIRSLHDVYGGLGSGRLVIAGSPGSGKTATGLLLLLESLRFRQQASPSDESKIPVPVLFSLSNWDPETTSAENWLSGELKRTYSFLNLPGYAGADRLIQTRQISAILDGLDEMPEYSRSPALAALNRLDIRVIVLTRIAEMAEAATGALFAGAVAIELQNLDAADVADYLTSAQLYPPPSGWDTIISDLRSSRHVHVARALASPLAVTLVRDTCRQPGDIERFRAFAASAKSPGKIVDFLLGDVITAAYARPASGHYTADLASRTLQVIASKMNEHATRDLRTEEITLWVSRWPANALCGILVGVVAGVWTGAWAAVQVNALAGAGAGVLAGAALGLAVMANALLEADDPDRGGFSTSIPIAVISIGAATWFGAHAADWTTGIAGRWVGITIGILAAVIMAVVVTVASSVVNFYGVLTTVLLLALVIERLVARPERLVILFPMAVSAELAILSGCAVYAGATALWGGQVGLVVASGVALTIAVRGTVLHAPRLFVWVAFWQLKSKCDTPLRLSDFLADARGRDVLRMVGKNYQFRHARLQDYLARASPNHEASPE